MGGFKRSLLAAGLMASGATSYLFPVPSPSSLSTTSTGQAIAARQAKHSLAHGASPPPRMGTAAMPRSEQATPRTAPGASSLGSSSSSSSSIAEPISVFPAVTRSRRPGIVARDGTRDDGRRERDDGKSPDFEVNLGRVISTLREDYPRILTDPPSFDIFTDEIELRDPTGVAFRGISNYKRVFSTLRFFRQTFMNDSSTTFRLTYDWSKQQVRITWSMVLQLKARQRPIHVDAISAYHINSNGLAYRHELETVVVNGTPVEPPYAYAWINLPAWVSRGTAARPAGNGAPAMPAPNGLISSPQFDFDLNFKDLSQTVVPEESAGSLLAAVRNDPELRGDFMSALSVLMAAEGVDSLGAGGGVEEGGSGLAAADMEEGAAVVETPKKEARTIKGKKKDGWFGLQGKWECDTSFDCTGGMVCCDFVLVKVCCSNGIRQPKFGDLVPSLVPIPGRGRNENDTPAKKRTPPQSPRNSPGW